jgi:mRNA interferase RelE/StbE
MADVRLAVSVRDELEDLPADTRDRVKQKFRDAGDRPDRHLKQLQGRDDYRLRIGDYRAVIDWDRDDDVLYVTDFGHRRNIYD